MEKFKNMLFNIKTFLTNNIYFKLLSLFIAIAVWFIIVWSIDPDVVTSIRNVPIQFDNSESLVMKKLGLNIIDGNNLFATVYIKGNRNIIGLIDADDLLVQAPIDNITEAGTYELEVDASVKNHMYKDVTFSAISPSVIKVKIDKIITKEIPIEVICNGTTAEPGYILEKAVPSVDVVTITGPERDVDKVDKATVICDVNKKLSKTLTLTEEISLSNNSLLQIETKYINLSTETINITLPVLKKKTLPIIVDFINQPKGFPIDELKYTVTPKTIEIAGLEEDVDKKESVNVAYIDLKKLYLDSENEYNINIPSNFVNVENVEKVKIDFHMDDMDSKIFSNVSIKVPYALADHDIEVNSKKLNNVKVVGKKDILSNLVSGDIVAEVELNNNDMSVGQITVPLNVYIPNKGLVWAVGDYKSIITIKDK